VGEIRDSETMQIAINAAMTGHLVLSTLHTNSASAAIPRMLDMKAEAFLIASTVNVIMAQRLVRRICADCKKSYKLTKAEALKLSEQVDFKEILSAISRTDVAEVKNLKNIKSFTDAEFFKGQGCERCSSEGYKGRVGIYEVLSVSEQIQKAIVESGTADQIEKIAKSEGMHSMLVDGVIKALMGTTTLEEVFRVTEE
jgi:type II secretory ATPase GspE/PulE/Tfp pilus assembly ATPase PilB-like protein